MDRRNFLKILGITSSTALATSCGVDKANETIIPYIIPPDEGVYPGKPVFISTTCSECPANCGVSVELNEKVYHDERALFPTKLEGLAGHPMNDGALCIRGQAGLFRLYHPDRIQRPMIKDADGKLRLATWKEALQKISDSLALAHSENKTNYYFSSRKSGTLSELIDEFCEKTKVRRVAEYEYLSHANIRQANQIVFNLKEIPHYRIDRADFLLSLGADLFETFVSPVEFARQFAKAKNSEHFEWIHLEPHLSLTGLQASQRMNLKPESESALLTFLIHSLLGSNTKHIGLPADLVQLIPKLALNEVAEQTGVAEDKLNEIAQKIAQSQSPLIIAGGVSTANRFGLQTAVLSALLQFVTGAVNKTVDFTHSLDYSRVGDSQDLEKFQNQLNGETAGVVFISQVDARSQISAPDGLLDGLKKSDLSVGLADVMNETVKHCDIILPLSHSLESWGDTKPRKGLRSIFQPVIDPEFQSRPEGDILLNLISLKEGQEQGQTFKDYLFEKWFSRYGETSTKEMLKSGLLLEETPPVQVSLAKQSLRAYLTGFERNPGTNTAVLVRTPSLRFFDGRSTDLPILHEIPDPVASISYGSWVSVSTKTAQEYELKNGDEVCMTSDGGAVNLPVRIQPLLPKNVFYATRESVQELKVASNPNQAEDSWLVGNVKIEKTGNRVRIPILSGSTREEGRGMLPEEDHHQTNENESMYPSHEHNTYRWGMAIDLESCIGCSACVAACYVENNVPIVGEKEHLKGREMSWIRIEPFYNEENKEAEFVPVMCQQCDNAPCEPVCPVYAAYHNPEGLNVQVYNRCVGTRYCSNNCPYKVRRFNWFDHKLPEPLDKMYNPDISVRGRGIMEKCTFCIQRIRQAKDTAKDEERIVKDGDLAPACAQTCPTDAITFGNLLEEKSKVYRLSQKDQSYRLLEELGTKPGVYYLKSSGHQEG